MAVLPPNHCPPFLISTSGGPNIYIPVALTDVRAGGKAQPRNPPTSSGKIPGTKEAGLRTAGVSPLCLCPSPWGPGLCGRSPRLQCSSFPGIKVSAPPQCAALHTGACTSLSWGGSCWDSLVLDGEASGTTLPLPAVLGP